jgi:hypothetical protein
VVSRIEFEENFFCHCSTMKLWIERKKAFWKKRATGMSLLVIIDRGQPIDLNMSIKMLVDYRR